MFMTKTIFGNLLKKYSTRLHPVEQRILPDGYRGQLRFASDKCILCRACAIKCPTKIIRIDPEIGLWEQEVMGCLYCGVCADVCPTDCIAMSNVYRPPLTEPAFLRFNVKPRPKKSAALKAEGAAGAAGKVETLEEDAATPDTGGKAKKAGTAETEIKGGTKKQKAV